jgi:peptidyl-dipeptidase Dcp
MNPLLADWITPFGIPPFAAIGEADFGPAFDAALAEGRAKIDAIAGTRPTTRSRRCNGT